MENPPSVYLETSFISYLTNRLSRDLIVAAHQQVTRSWWEKREEEFDFFVSEVVIREISRGDKEESKKRLELVKKIARVLTIDQETEKLAKKFIQKVGLPKKAFDDALHMAIAATSGIDYLLTWNCKHIANIEIINAIIGLCESLDYKAPLICTPLEFMGDLEYE